MNMYEIVKEGLFKATHPTGSRYICNPSPTDTDEDYICLIDKISGIDKDLVGFVMDGSFPTDEQAKKDDIFISFKKGNLNLIVTADVNFYNKFIACSKVAKKLNLIKKQDRITLFQFGLYGNYDS